MQTDGRTDGHDERNSRFSGAREFPENKTKKKGYKRHLKPLPQYLHIDLSAVTFIHTGKSRQESYNYTYYVY